MDVELLMEMIYIILFVYLDIFLLMYLTFIGSHIIVFLCQLKKEKKEKTL